MNVTTTSRWIGPSGLVLISVTLLLAGCASKPDLHKLDPGTDKQAQADSPFYHALSMGSVTVDERSNPRADLLETVVPEDLQVTVESVLQSANLLSANDPGTFILNVQFLYAEDVFVDSGFVGHSRINTLISYSISDRATGESTFTEAISGSYESSGMGDGVSFGGRLQTAFEQSVRFLV